MKNKHSRTPFILSDNTICDEDARLFIREYGQKDAYPFVVRARPLSARTVDRIFSLSRSVEASIDSMRTGGKDSLKARYAQETTEALNARLLSALQRFTQRGKPQQTQREVYEQLLRDGNTALDREGTIGMLIAVSAANLAKQAMHRDPLLRRSPEFSSPPRLQESGVSFHSLLTVVVLLRLRSEGRIPDNLKELDPETLCTLICCFNLLQRIFAASAPAQPRRVVFEGQSPVLPKLIPPDLQGVDLTALALQLCSGMIAVGLDDAFACLCEERAFLYDLRLRTLSAEVSFRLRSMEDAAPDDKPSPPWIKREPWRRR